MKKILLILLTFTTILISDPLQVDLNQIQEETGKKTYQNLIKVLGSSPKSAHTLALALIYLNGIQTPDIEGNVVKKDIQKSKFYFNKAIDMDNVNAYEILGSLYVYNEDLSQEEDANKKAETLLQQAIKKGSKTAIPVLSELYFKKLDAPIKGLSYLQLAAEEQIPGSQLLLALLYRYGPEDARLKPHIQQNIQKANMLLDLACTNKKSTQKIKEFCSQYKINKPQ